MLPQYQLMQRLAIHINEGQRETGDLDDVYYIETTQANTLIRVVNKRLRRDIRILAVMEKILRSTSFFRIQRSYLVNLDRIRLLRMRDFGRDWEVVIAPPVNRVLPVSRRVVEALLVALEHYLELSLDINSTRWLKLRSCTLDR